jgi:hypothetical protein
MNTLIINTGRRGGHDYYMSQGSGVYLTKF